MKKKILSTVSLALSAVLMMTLFSSCGNDTPNAKLDRCVDQNNYYGAVEALNEGADVTKYSKFKFTIFDSESINEHNYAAKAFMNNYDAIGKLLIEHGSDVNYLQYDGTTYLMNAANMNNYALVDFLLNHGADISQKSDLEKSVPKEITALDYIFINSSVETAYDSIKMAEYLVEKGAVPTKNTLDAVWKYNYEEHPTTVYSVIRYVVSLLDKFDVDTGMNAILKAIILGKNEEAIKLATSEKWDNATDDIKNLCLFYAAAFGSPELMKTLVYTNGCKLNSYDKNDQSLVMIAAGYNDVDMLKYLHTQSQGLNIYTKNDDDINGLTLALMNNNVATAKYLFENGVTTQPDTESDSNYTLINMTNGHVYKEAAMFMIDNVGLSGYDIYSIYSAAIMQNDIDFLKALYEKGAKPSAEDSGGESLMSYACEYANEDIIKLLLQKGENINGSPNDIPLSDAIYWGRTDVAKLLVDNNANVNRTIDENYVYYSYDGSDYNSSPVSTAISVGNYDILKYLVENGAVISEDDAALADESVCMKISEYVKQNVKKAATTLPNT